MYKFISVDTLAKLNVCMRSSRLDSYDGSDENILKIFNLANAYRTHKNIIKVSREDIYMIILFIMDNQTTLKNDSVNILDVLSIFTSIYFTTQRQRKVKKPKKEFYFKMNMGVNSEDKIKCIKALRDLVRADYNKDDIKNSPYSSEFTGLKWAKYAIESNTIFGPVSMQFLDSCEEYHYLMVFSPPDGCFPGTSYKNFIEAFN